MLHIFYLVIRLSSSQTILSQRLLSGWRTPVWFGSSILIAFVLLGPGGFLTHWFQWDFLWGKILYNISEVMRVWPFPVQRDIKSPLLQGLSKLENLLNSSFGMRFPIYIYIYSCFAWGAEFPGLTPKLMWRREGGGWLSSWSGKLVGSIRSHHNLGPWLVIYNCEK